MVTNAKEWKKAGDTGLVDLELPSGNVCQVRAPGMQAFLAKGLIPNSLMGHIKDRLEANAGKQSPAQRKKAEAEAARQMMEDISKDPEKIQDLLDLCDRVVLECVKQPHVEPAPEDEDDRDPDLLYVDEVELDDKMHIFNFAVGGTRDAQQFRSQSNELVAAAEDERPVVKATKRTGGAKKSARRN